jgi:hypothetical protein
MTKPALFEGLMSLVSQQSAQDRSSMNQIRKLTKKKTKIVCTMGPATEDDKVLRKLILEGMNVARFNFSHGSHEYHRRNIARVRAI